MSRTPLLEVKDLTIGFRTWEGTEVPITDGISFEIHRGEFYGLVGESGCGKTVTALALLRLLPHPGGRIIDGQVLFEGKDTLSISPADLSDIRGREISMIFQGSAATFNPLLTMERQLMEVFDYHPFGGNAGKHLREQLRRVGFPDPRLILRSYPHELSGGMLQRVGICMALLLRPKLVLADEPTTALDVTVQAQILELLLELQQETGLAVLFINHNLNLIAQYADRLAVMYAGRIIEQAGVEDFFKRPAHPYSQGLLQALPDLKTRESDLKPIPGQVPRPIDFVGGCRFQDRCSESGEMCQRKPPAYPIGENHFVNCFLYAQQDRPDGVSTGK